MADMANLRIRCYRSHDPVWRAFWATRSLHGGLWARLAWASRNCGAGGVCSRRHGGAHCKANASVYAQLRCSRMRRHGLRSDICTNSLTEKRPFSHPTAVG